MNYQHQYIEPLIKLIELNSDHQWLPAFYNLRNGGFLPGGGYGSLNDWGPYYSTREDSCWYGKLYSLFRFLYDDNLPPRQVVNFPDIKAKNKFLILRCLNCSKNYQHPNIFESHIAIYFYATHFVNLAETSRMDDLFNSELTYNSTWTANFRHQLTEEYAKNDIKLYDFVHGKNICPHCSLKYYTEHDLYFLNPVPNGPLTLEKRKNNASLKDLDVSD